MAAFSWPAGRLYRVTMRGRYRTVRIRYRMRVMV
jgi:hypothetical protein